MGGFALVGVVAEGGFAGGNFAFAFVEEGDLKFLVFFIFWVVTSGTFLAVSFVFSICVERKRELVGEIFTTRTHIGETIPLPELNLLFFLLLIGIILFKTQISKGVLYGGVIEAAVWLELVVLGDEEILGVDRFGVEMGTGMRLMFLSGW